MTETAQYAVGTPPLSDTLGFRRVIEVSDGRVEIEYEAGLHMCHSGGIVQGGFVTAWIDAAMAEAVRSRGGEDALALTLEIKVSYFEPARPGLVRAHAWIERMGRTTGFVEGLLQSPNGDTIAKASSTVRIGSVARAQEAARKALGT